jgi:hypothetical protein
MPKERPLHIIKSLLELNLDDASRRGPLPSILPKKFLQEIDIINHVSLTQESILHRTNYTLKNISNTTS